MSNDVSMDEVYREYSIMVYKYLLSKTHDEGLAEELTQEAFYRAVKSVNRYDCTCRVSTWLCAIAKNVYLEYIRKNPPNDELTDDIEQKISLESSYIEKEGHLRILTAIHNMPEPSREVLHLRLLSDLSFKEIGEIMDKSEEWARVTYYRAKLKLRKELERYEQN